MATYRKDIPEIAAVLCARISSRLGRKFRLSTAALRLVAEHEWRGQARQIAQLIERAIHFSSGQLVRRETLELMIHESADNLSHYRTLHQENQQDLLTQTLRQCGGNISLTARRLNRSRGAVYRMLSKYRIPLERGN
jgi:DNA-binding NtrC family response regulator